MAIDYNVFYASKGAAYRDEKIVKWSHYKEPVEKRPGRVGGNSRIWGDASHETQRIVINGLIAAAKKNGFNTRRIAMLLAMAYIESGFNPDAAAGTTSASGLGQFIDDTGLAFGLDKSNRFDVTANITALIEYFEYNEKIAKKKGKPDVWVYKYHHDGPTADYGGAKLVTEKFAPLTEKFQKALTAGHSITIVDPEGAPIADARVKVSQNGKTAVLKTNEHGNLPSILAHPDFGPVTVFIQKTNDEFKELGALAISTFESVWTVVAPKQRFPVKTHVHEPHPGQQPAATDTHKVKSGETISRIAREHETTYQELAKLNGIEKPYLIFPGQVLKVPARKAVGAKDKAASAATPGAAAHKPAANSPAANSPAAPAATKLPDSGAAKPAAAPTRSRPVVEEKRSEGAQHPVAKVVASEPSDKIRAMITYAMEHKEPKSVHRCLRYVKRALVAAHLFAKYPGCEHAKDFGPYLKKEGFDNLLETKPGTNLNNAPFGSVIIYKPVESQTHNGKTISGHIEIKHEGGFVSDFNGKFPTYQTDPVTMVSPKHFSYKVTFKVIGIWFKDK